MQIDGRNFLPLLQQGEGGRQGKEGQTTVSRGGVGGLEGAAVVSSSSDVAKWRDHVFIEYYYVGLGPYCGMGPIEQPDNNFIAVRHLPQSKLGNILYVGRTFERMGGYEVRRMRMLVGVSVSVSHSHSHLHTHTPIPIHIHTKHISLRLSSSLLRYVEFQNGTDGNIAFDSINHYELFDMDVDPWQLTNMYVDSLPVIAIIGSST